MADSDIIVSLHLVIPFISMSQAFCPKIISDLLEPHFLLKCHVFSTK
jgi:hypothetical protein